MPPDLFILISVFFAVTLGLMWEEYHRWRDDQRFKRARCEHAPGDPRAVAGSRTMFKQFCVKCGAQRHCNHAGEPDGDWEL